jgi:hypothetical protein
MRFDPIPSSILHVLPLSTSVVFACRVFVAIDSNPRIHSVSQSSSTSHIHNCSFLAVNIWSTVDVILRTVAVQCAGNFADTFVYGRRFPETALSAPPSPTPPSSLENALSSPLMPTQTVDRLPLTFHSPPSDWLLNVWGPVLCTLMFAAVGAKHRPSPSTLMLSQLFHHRTNIP